MSAWRKTRAIVALAAAYAVAAQAILLAVGPIGGATGLAAASLCSASHAGADHTAPGGKEHDCPAACAACCCGAPVASPSAAAATAAYEQAPAGSVPAVPADAATWYFKLDRAHRSRAPPLA